MSRYIEVNKLTDKGILNKITKHCWSIDSKASLKRWYESRHSPIYTQQFVIFLTAEKSVMEQLRTHEKNGCQFYCDSGRPDTGNNKEGVGRSAMRNFAIFCNASHLLSIAEKRLCYNAELATWETTMLLREEVRRVDSGLADKMRPACAIYRDGCTEFFSCKMKHRELPEGCKPCIRMPGREFSKGEYKVGHLLIPTFGYIIGNAVIRDITRSETGNMYKCETEVGGVINLTLEEIDNYFYLNNYSVKDK